MATKVIDKVFQRDLYKKNKKYIYSWETDNLDGSVPQATVLQFTASASSTLFDLSASTQDKVVKDDQGNRKAVTLASGTKSPSAGIVFNGFGYYYTKRVREGRTVVTKAYTNDVTTVYANAIELDGVNATTVYGGGVMSSSDKSLRPLTKQTDGFLTVEGGSDITIKSARVSSVYGGGAGYGSTLNGDVSISVSGSSNISAIYGGGYSGAVVNGNVQIDIDRADARSGRISAIYGGGYNATVNGDVTVTIHGANAISVGAISGSGRGKSVVTGTRTLEIVDYSGKFTTTIKDFDLIQISGASSVTLTQSQQRSIQSATYEFVVDQTAIGQTGAMLTWNRKVNLGQMVITVDADVADVAENGFKKTIYSSTYATKDIVNNILVQTAEGQTLSSSMYTLEFVYNDAKSEKRGMGGYVVLNYVGANVSIDGDTEKDQKFTDADDEVTLKGDLIRNNVNTAEGNDRVTVQKETVMAGNISLGTGDNELVVQGDSEVTGMIYLAEGTENEAVNNTIRLDGAISAISGGNEYTNNTVYINTVNAVGYYQRTDSGSDDSLNRPSTFVPQTLAFFNKSNDTVILSETATDTPSISFAKGKDTLVLNSDLADGAKITANDGQDVIVVNQTGVAIDADAFKLVGEDNSLVIANGASAKIDNITLTDLESEFAAIYLSQNAMITVDGTKAVQSYARNITLKAGEELIVMPVAKPAADNARIDTINEYYTSGEGVTKAISANGAKVTLRTGAKVSGPIYGDGATVALNEGATMNGNLAGEGLAVTLKKDAVLNGAIDGGDTGATVSFKGDAGGNITFSNVKISVANGKKATVGSIEGLDIAESELDKFAALEADLANITLENNATVYATDDKLTVLGATTKDTGVLTDNVALKGTVSAGATVSFKDAAAYVGQTADVTQATLSFEGENEVVFAKDATLDNKKISFATDTSKATFNVVDDAAVEIKGIVKDEAYNDKITVGALGQNAVFASDDKIVTGNWDKAIATGTNATAAQNLVAKAANKEIEIREGSTIEAGMVLTGSKNTITVGKDATIKNNVAGTAIQLSGGNNTLNVGQTQIYGAVQLGTNNSAAFTETQIDAVDGEVALTGAGSSTATITATKTDINGKVTLTAMKSVSLENSTIEGDVALNSSQDVAITSSTITGNVAASGVKKAALENSTVAGDLTDGTLVTLNESTVTGKMTGTVEATASKIGEYYNASAPTTTGAAGLTVKGAATDVTEITKFTQGKVVVDGATAKFDEISNSVNTSGTKIATSAELRVMNGGKVDGDITMATDTLALVDVIDTEVAAIDQTSNQAGVDFKYTTTENNAQKVIYATTAKTGDITQRGVTTSTGTIQSGNAHVDATYKLEQKYSDSTLSKAALDPVTLAKIERTTGKITQSATSQNTFDGSVTITANGRYSGTYDKPAQVTVGSVTDTYGAIEQTAGTNSVKAIYTYTADGEADVNIGKTALSVASITQETSADGRSNTVDVELIAKSGANKNAQQSILTLDGMSATLGAIKQTSYASTNTVTLKTSLYEEDTDATVTKAAGKAYGQLAGDTTQKITVDSIDMRAYAGTNTLTLAGNVEVTGDVNVGGVLEVGDATYNITVDSSWGDRVASTNTVTVDVDTVKIGGNLTLVGLTNNLNLNNASAVEGVTLAENIYIVGDTNIVDVADGVSTKNIKFYELQDYDKIGQEGYDLGTGTFSNTIYVRGEVADIITEQENGTDKVKVLGGTVWGSIVTKNGKGATTSEYDEVTLGSTNKNDYLRNSGDGTTIVKGAVDDSVVGGDITMGIEGAASGKTVLTLNKVIADDAGVEHTNTVEGNVSQFSDVSNVITANEESKIGGDIKQVVTQEATELTVNGEKVYGYKKVDANIKNEIVATSADIAEGKTVSQTMEGSNKNIFTFKDSDGVVYSDLATTGFDDKVVGYSYDKTVGTVKQSGADNNVTITNAKSMDGIVQTAQAVNGVETTTVSSSRYQYKHTTNLGKVLKDNTVTIATVDTTGAVTGGSFGTFGAIEQTLTNEAYKKYTNEQTTSSSTAPTVVNFTDAGTDAFTTNGNTLTVQGVKTEVYNKDAATPPKSADDVFSNDGQFVTTIGDVTQTLNGVDKDTAAKNTITLKDVNTGILTQNATGNVENTITYTGTEIDQYKLAEAVDPETDPTRHAVVDETMKVRATIAGIAQDAKILALDADVDGNVTTQKNLVATNTITLSKVDVTGNISATTETAYDTTTTTDAQGTAKTVKDQLVAAQAIISLTDVTVAGGITTGFADDEIKLDGKTKVAGEIKMQDFVNEAKNASAENDRILIQTATIDLTEAKISGVEQFIVQDFVSSDKLGETITVDTLEADLASFENTTDLAPEAFNEIKGNAISLGGTDNLQVISSLGDDKSLAATITGNITSLTVNGGKDATDDSLTITGATLSSSLIRGVETVTFGEGGLSSTSNEWANASTDGKIAFTGVTFTATFDTFELGAFNGYELADVTINGWKYNTTEKYWTATGDAAADGEQYLRYDAETKILTRYTKDTFPLTVSEDREGSIDGTGSDDEVYLKASVNGNIFLKGDNDEVKVEAESVVAGAIDLGDGSEDTLNVNANLTTAKVANAETISVAKDMTLTAEKVLNAEKIDGTVNAQVIGDGTSSTDKITLKGTTSVGEVRDYQGGIKLEKLNPVKLADVTLNGSATYSDGTTGIDITAANDDKDILTLAAGAEDEAVFGRENAYLYGDIDLGDKALSDDVVDELNIKTVVKTGEIKNVEIIDATSTAEQAASLTSSDALDMVAENFSGKIDFSEKKAEVRSMTAGSLTGMNDLVDTEDNIKTVEFATTADYVTGLDWDKRAKADEKAADGVIKSAEVVVNSDKTTTNTVVVAKGEAFELGGNVQVKVADKAAVFSIADTSDTKVAQINLDNNTLAIEGADILAQNLGDYSDITKIDVAEGFELKTNTATLSNFTEVSGAVDANFSLATGKTLTLKGEAKIGDVTTVSGTGQTVQLANENDKSYAIATIGSASGIAINGANDADVADTLNLLGTTYGSIDLKNGDDTVTFGDGLTGSISSLTFGEGNDTLKVGAGAKLTINTLDVDKLENLDLADSAKLELGTAAYSAAVTRAATDEAWRNYIANGQITSVVS